MTMTKQSGFAPNDNRKKQQRRMALTARSALSPQERQAASLAICECLMALPEVQNARVILSYAATAEEVSLADLHEWLWQQGKVLAFPVTEGAGVMYAVRAEQDTPWQGGRYGIPEPMGETLPPEELDLVLTPCVAFDEHCRRLGHGGGYYDRYLPRCPQALRIAAAFEAQKVSEISTDSHDLPMDRVVTERCVYE